MTVGVDQAVSVNAAVPGLLFLGDPGPGGSRQTVAPAAEIVFDPAGGADQLAAAAWWVILEPEVWLEPHAVAAFAEFIEDLPDDVTAFYCDFLERSHADLRHHMIGGWSPERFLWQDYTGKVAVVRADVLAAEVASADLRRAALRAAASGDVRYLPKTLYSVPFGDLVPTTGEAERAALMARRSVPYDIEIRADGVHRTPIDPVKVSIVIPTRGTVAKGREGRVRLVDNLLEHLTATTDLPPEIVLVLDADGDVDFVAQWRRRLGDSLKVVETPGPFNFSVKVNAGAEAASGDVIVFLNDDIEPISDDWLSNVVALALEPDVGAVGALLFYEDGTIQHAGQYFARSGVHHVDVGEIPSNSDRNRSAVDRDVTGVTGACLAQRAEVWRELGGFDPMLPSSFNDVDYCMRIRRHGYRIVQCNSARLFHFESKSRNEVTPAGFARLMHTRWADDWLREDDLSPDRRDPNDIRQPKGERIAKARGIYREQGASGLFTAVRKRVAGRNS